MQLFIIIIFIVLGVGVISSYPGLVLASHEESNSEDKKLSDSNNDPKSRSSDKQSSPTNDQNGDSTTNIPTVGNVVIPLQETVVQQQNTVTPHMTQPVHTGYLDNSLNTISTQDKDIKDNGGQSSGTISNSDSDNELTMQEDKNNFSDKNLGSESRYIIMQQDNGQVGLFQIISNEDNMSVNILPKTIRSIEPFDSTAEALSWINDYDNRSN
jgi:hypothetical protein